MTRPAPERVVAGLGLACLGAAVVLLVWTFRPIPSAPPHGSDAARAALDAPPSAPSLLVSSMDRETYRRVAAVRLDDPDGARYVSPLVCDRVHANGGRGVCLSTTLEGVATVHRARLFDQAFRETATLALTGVPSRARVAPDGRLAAVTVFETGHAYDQAGFSTRTSIIDVRAGAIVGDLEQFAVLRDGQSFRAVDFNFWGVTFARDGDRFLATLATAGRTHLVEGQVSRRTMSLLGHDGECPSLSPDNRRVAYKHRLPGGTWQIHVWDRVTDRVTPLTGEGRSVDDQVEWLDDARLLYHVTGAGGADVWMLDLARPDAPPHRLVRAAYSPAVLR